MHWRMVRRAIRSAVKAAEMEDAGEAGVLTRPADGGEEGILSRAADEGGEGGLTRSGGVAGVTTATGDPGGRLTGSNTATGPD